MTEAERVTAEAATTRLQGFLQQLTSSPRRCCQRHRWRKLVQPKHQLLEGQLSISVEIQHVKELSTGLLCLRLTSMCLQ